jgi:hypothetical protein
MIYGGVYTGRMSSMSRLSGAVPKFSQRDYELAATVIRDTAAMFRKGAANSVVSTSVLAHVSAAFAREFAADNPKFDRHRFADACFPKRKEEANSE